MAQRMIVILKAKKEEASKVGEILAEGARLTRQNDVGCIDYTVVQDKADPATFIFIEHWKDQKSIEAHMKAPHFIDMNKKLRGKTAGAPTLYRVEAKV
ncbi:hypothetical protein M427DRAFT_159137 [Gonapodya prolifera JEL478]|uniref:ABM domain-containing protein n=1 Tax=Gonapodya prolifera (strain JEL478) TaxID=1344416 RepID=A0A139A1L5_GONPJ|nr:hypothetical protein M427DRAFT_159137 [Gonapodya prolifera JEL478]|eukprot:KXS10518.1 hypothetical protein M427DRAFT_159137 [Gonapodya prolifera JEL478]